MLKVILFCRKFDFLLGIGSSRGFFICCWNLYLEIELFFWGFLFKVIFRELFRFGYIRVYDMRLSWRGFGVILVIKIVYILSSKIKSVVIVVSEGYLSF